MGDDRPVDLGREMGLLKKLLIPKKMGKTARMGPGDDTLGRGPDMAITAGVFLLIGLGVDSLTNTRPLFTIVLTVLSLVGSFVRMWYVYDGRMSEMQKRRHAEATSHQHGDNT